MGSSLFPFNFLIQWLYFMIILIRGYLISLSVIVNIRWINGGGSVIFWSGGFKCMSQHCLIHLIINYIPAISISTLFIVWYHCIFNVFWDFMCFLWCIILFLQRLRNNFLWFFLFNKDSILWKLSFECLLANSNGTKQVLSLLVISELISLR